MAKKQMLKRVFSVDHPPSLEFLTLDSISFVPNPESLSGPQGIISAIVFGESAPALAPVRISSTLVSWFFTKETNYFNGCVNCLEEKSSTFNLLKGFVEGV